MNKFEWYKPRSGRPYVSIVKYRVSFSDGLVKEMGRPEYVKLGYSDESKSIVIKPCVSDDEYKIKVTGGKTPRILSRGFIRFLITKGIQIGDKSRKHIATWNKQDGICLVELK